jgi:hypothetical protein
VIAGSTSQQGPQPAVAVQPVAPGAVNSPSSLLFSYQGQLTDAAGNPIPNAALPMTFRLYTVASGGTACWTEARTGANPVNVQNGLFQVLLGQLTTIPTSCLTGDAYLELVVNGETLSPRELLTSVAFAVEARTVPDGVITAVKIADGAVTSAKIQDGQVTSADIADNTITEDDISDSFKARDADKLDGLNSSYFAAGGHTHDDRYFTEGESDSRFINASGDTVNGDLTATGKIAAKGELWADSNLSVYGVGIFGQPNVGEGGELALRPGDAGNGWTLDNNRGQFRLHHDGTVYFTVATNGDTAVGGNNIYLGGSTNEHVVLRQDGDQSNLFLVPWGGPGRLYDRVTIGSGHDYRTDLFVWGNIAGTNYYMGGTDFIMSDVPGRGDGGRALVHDNNDTLTINYGGDFAGGVRINGPLACGALVESNLQTPQEQDSGGTDRFTEGDVLCWGIDQLELCVTANDRLVQAVADKDGKPIVLGAEKVKVLGPVQRGDILVASSVPGYAMVNNEPRSGSVIAQALENFDGQRGVIKAMIRKW